MARAERVRETTTTTGVGTYNLAGAVQGFQTFVAGVGNSQTVRYICTDGTDWEVGEGTITDAAPDTLSRTTIIDSSNAGAAVNWGAGDKDIAMALTADEMDAIDTAIAARLLASNNLSDVANVTTAQQNLNLEPGVDVQAYNAGTLVGLTAGTGLSSTGGTSPTLALDFSELTDKTTAIAGTTEFIIQDGTTESRKAASEIDLSFFNNDQGWTSNAGTVTSVSGGVGIASTGGATPSLSLTVDELSEKTGAVVGADRLVGTSGTTNFAETISGIPLSIFNNDAGWTSNAGTVTSVTGGTGITSTGGATPSLSLDFSELTDMTGAIAGTTELILQDGTTESRKAASEIDLSAFNNDLTIINDFLNLTDVDPSTYVGQAGKLVRVNAVPDGLEFVDSVAAGDMEAFGCVKTTDQAFTTQADIVSWATAHQTSQDITFNVTTGVATFDVAGLYLITFDVSIEGTSGSGRSQANVEMHLDTGGGFALVAGTNREIYMRQISHGGSATITYVISAGVGDDIKFLIERSAGTDSISIRDASLSIVTLTGAKGDPGGAVADGDYGDITISGTGTIYTIDADSVTMDKLVDIATDSFLGRTTAATGTVEVLTVAQAKTMLDLTGTNSGDDPGVTSIDITGGTGITSSGGPITGSGSITVNVDLSELTTSTADADGDFFVVVDSVNAQKKLTKANINLSGFNNDSGWTSNTGTVTSVTGGTGIASTGGATPSLSLTVDELSEKTGALVGTDRLVGTSGTTNFAETINQIPLSIFSNDSGWTNNTGTVTSVGITAGTLIDVTGSPVTGSGSITVDVDLSEATEAILAVATDYMLFLDGGVTGTAAKESVADFVSAIAGTGLTATSGVLSADTPTVAMNDITDAVITSPTDAQIMIYEQTAGDWINRTVSGDITISDTGDVNIQGSAITSKSNITAPLNAAQDEFFISDNGVLKACTWQVVLDSIEQSTLEMQRQIRKSFTTVTASTSQNQSGATGLSLLYDVHEIEICNNSGDSVKLPGAVAGEYLTIINSGNQPAQIWPNTSDTINEGAANAADPILLAPLATRIYVAVDGVGWFSLNGSNDNISMSDNELVAPIIKDYGIKTEDLTAFISGTKTINLNNGNCFTGTVIGATTWTFSNPTASDDECSFILYLKNGGSYTQTWPTSVDWAAGAAPALTATGTDILAFSTVDGGTIWHGKPISLDSK